MGRSPSRVVAAVATGLLLLLGGAWAVSGWSAAVLGSPSMAPWAEPGALLLHREVPATAIEVGDVVTVQVPGRGLVTHRVVEVAAPPDAPPVAVLKGDRSLLPDPGPVVLPGQVARVALVVPRLGDALVVGGPLLAVGAVLLVLGIAALALGGPGHRTVRTVAEAPSGVAEPGPAARPDPRIEALLASCEQFAEDGMPPVVVADLVRVRTAEVLGLPSAERSGAVRELDDGSRFYVVALTDADPEALRVVPVESARRRAATEALHDWWAVVGDRVPAATATTIEPWLR